MRFPAVAALAAALIAPSLAWSLELDTRPITWRGVQLAGEQTYEGDFTTNFETSTFRPDGAAAAEAMWLAGWEDRPGDDAALPRRYHIRFVGRRTVEPGRYGSLGAYKHTVLIVRLMSARVLIGQADAASVSRP